MGRSAQYLVYGTVRQGAGHGILRKRLNGSFRPVCSIVSIKLFLFDTGLLKHMAGIDNSAILLKADYQFKGPLKGPLTENYIL